MPINDNFMLPKWVRTMEPMADLLAAEQMELTQAQRIIAALENQGVISTSTLLLARHERIFDLSTNPTESLGVRRMRLLAKLNTHGTTTVQAIKEMVKIVTGREGDVIEHFEGYSFSVIVHLLFPDETTAMQELIQQIEEIKPAHLVFDTTAAVEPIRVINQHHHSLHRLEIHAHVDNLGIFFPRFNGWSRFGQEISFGGQVTKGLQLRKLFMHMKVGNRWQGVPCVGFKAHLRTSNTHSIEANVRSAASNTEQLNPQTVMIHTACKNPNTHPATLTKDSRWHFGQEFTFDGTRRFNGAGYTKEEL